MENVLLVSSTQKGVEYLGGLLQAHNLPQVTTVPNGGKARRILLENNFDLIIINTPLTDEFGHELAVSMSQSTLSGILLVVKAEQADAVSEKVEEAGVLVVPKPMNQQLFFQSLKFLQASRRRMLGLQKENVKLQKKIEEIKLVDRAKCALIEHEGISEEQAHRRIEKRAMDLRLTRKEIAEDILDTYDS